MNDPYEQFKKITDKYYTDWNMPNINVFVELLNRYGIKLRQKDGELHEITFSKPESKEEALVLGVRYKKKDNSYSEDLFLFQQGEKIEKGYKGRLEKGIIPEYSGTHKELPNT